MQKFSLIYIHLATGLCYNGKDIEKVGKKFEKELEKKFEESP